MAASSSSLRHVLLLRPRLPLNPNPNSNPSSHFRLGRHRRLLASSSSSSSTLPHGDTSEPPSPPAEASVVDVNPPRGTRDFPPEDMRLRTWLFDHFREVSRIMTFEEVDFPVLESEALFIRKAGEEITQQLYNFEDKGGRRVVLRPEITPSLARLVIKQGTMTRGRRREHYQWNMDIFGVPKVRAEAELLQAIVMLFERLGITSVDVGIRVSSRKVLQAVLHIYSIPEHLFTEVCVIVDKELKTGKVIGIGERHESFYHIKQEKEVADQRAYVAGVPELELITWHRRLGHMSFSALQRLYPDLFFKCDKSKQVCDAYEFAKHTRTMYPSVGHKSSNLFDVVHSDAWGPSRVVSTSGCRWFVAFIDCFSRVTWLFLIQSKSEVLNCFKRFHQMVETQDGKKVLVLRWDNSTEYTNNAMQEFLSGQGIIHQTTCVNTPEQNGVAERKNRHILEVTRCLLFTMNVPKYLWGEAVQTAVYLINRMP